MCVFHWAFLLFVKYRGANRGALHTLQSYAYAIGSILGVCMALFSVSFVMMTVDQIYGARIPRNVTAIPATVAGVLLLLSILEAAALCRTIYKLWLQYRIERSGGDADDASSFSPLSQTASVPGYEGNGERCVEELETAASKLGDLQNATYVDVTASGEDSDY